MSRINLQKFSLKKKQGGDEQICYNCSFCGKLVALDVDHRKMCERVSGEKFFCPSCLRHGFDTRANRDVLVLTFRGVIGYIYYAHYCSTDGELTLAELRDKIWAHQHAGLRNPVFSYDPETYLWFVNFAKVGVGRKKIDLDDVLTTVADMAVSFEFNEVPTGEIVPRFEKAIRKFYEQRFRPPDQRMLCPTFSGIANDLPEGCTMDMTRSFTPAQLFLRN